MSQGVHFLSCGQPTYKYHMINKPLFPPELKQYLYLLLSFHINLNLFQDYQCVYSHSSFMASFNIKQSMPYFIVFPFPNFLSSFSYTNQKSIYSYFLPQTLFALDCRHQVYILFWEGLTFFIRYSSRNKTYLSIMQVLFCSICFIL